MRLAWIAGGNALLGMLAVLIARDDRWTLTVKDALFWTLVASVPVLRYVDWKRFGGTTTDGEPTTARLVRRHAALFVGAWLALWTMAQSVALG